jgi:hypothetical protein
VRGLSRHVARRRGGPRSAARRQIWVTTALGKARALDHKILSKAGTEKFFLDAERRPEAQPYVFHNLFVPYKLVRAF